MMKKRKRSPEATAIGEAYKRADTIRYANAPDVIGFQINLSNNHPEKNLCDELIGVYPTGFIFEGHDDECMCFVTPVMSSEEEFSEYLEALGNGEPYEFKSKIIELPNNFKVWVRENRYFLDDWDSAPSMITDNFTKTDIRNRIEGREPSLLQKVKSLVSRISG